MAVTLHFADEPDLPAALGQLVMLWSQLELDLGHLLIRLIPLKAPVDGAVLGNIGFREKIDVLKAVGYLKKPTDCWYDDLAEVLNYLNETLRPERNRLIHNVWFLEREGYTHTHLTPKVKRAQARTLEYVPFERKIVTTAYLVDLMDRVTAVMLALSGLRSGLDWPHDTSPERRSRLRLPEA